MTFMIPYRPIHLEVTMSDGIGKVYISLLLTLKKGLPEGSLTDLTTFGVKWSSFDPLPHCVHKCSYWIAPCGFKVGHQVPWTKCDTRDANSMSRAFFLQKQISNKTLEQQGSVPISQLTNYMSMPFSLTPKANNELFELIIPRSSLEVPQDIAIYILACTDSQTMPMTIVGHSKALSQQLQAMMNSGKSFSASEHLKIEFTGVNDQLVQKVQPTVGHEARTLCNQFLTSVCTMELLIKPSDQVLLFVREQMGLPIDEEAMEELKRDGEAMVGQPRGTYDFFNEKDRWQFLSKELSQK